MQIVGVITRETALKLKGMGYTAQQANNIILCEASRRHPDFSLFILTPRGNNLHDLNIVGIEYTSWQENSPQQHNQS